MSATADKARYFLEQSVPELKEFERKKIFSPEEITSIAKRRSDFEHKINARGSSPSDYVQYAEFEINVDALRKKRVKRMGIKSTAYNGQRRIFFVFDRGTRKFPGDIGLWMQSIDYTRQRKSYKRLTQTFTNVLRLHPSNADLWIYAAQAAMDDNADMSEARSYMQRGLRFCKTCRKIWLQYAQLELAYMLKLMLRKQVLGIPKTKENDVRQTVEDSEDVIQLIASNAEDSDSDSNMTPDVNQIAMQLPEGSLINSGAIPLAIFDAAMNQFRFDAALGLAFFELIASFDQLSVVCKLLDHVIESLSLHAAQAWQTQACRISRPLVAVSSNQPEYPTALRQTLRSIQNGLAATDSQSQLIDWCEDWLQQQLCDDMDRALQKVVRAQISALSVPIR